jgi:hypothetical protein
MDNEVQVDSVHHLPFVDRWVPRPARQHSNDVAAIVVLTSEAPPAIRHAESSVLLTVPRHATADLLTALLAMATDNIHLDTVPKDTAPKDIAPKDIILQVAKLVRAASILDIVHHLKDARPAAAIDLRAVPVGLRKMDLEAATDLNVRKPSGILPNGWKRKIPTSCPPSFSTSFPPVKSC